MHTCPDEIIIQPEKKLFCHFSKLFCIAWAQTERLIIMECYTQDLINWLTKTHRNLHCLWNINIDFVPLLQVTLFQPIVKLMRTDINTVLVTGARQTVMFIRKF